eukprot:365524-Chlamydomonas_euryale.AAC.9
MIAPVVLVVLVVVHHHQHVLLLPPTGPGSPGSGVPTEGARRSGARQQALLVNPHGHWRCACARAAAGFAGRGSGGSRPPPLADAPPSPIHNAPIPLPPIRSRRLGALTVPAANRRAQPSTPRPSPPTPAARRQAPADQPADFNPRKVQRSPQANIT